MGEIGGFKKFARADPPERGPGERIGDHREFVRSLPLVELQEQGARCMECGVPFCHHGCPLGNLIPDWNDLVYRNRFREAIDQLHRTNNFPEFTGRLCPAPCEAACVLEIDEGNAVTIKQIELAIVNRAWEEGWIVPELPASRSGRTVAVVGSGPAGLACAQQLNRTGHTVTVFERDEAGGGLVRFGIPDFKIEKDVVERRLAQLAEEGIEFRFGVDVGSDIDATELRESFDAVVLATGSRVPRNLGVPGRELGGVHFAMEYLYGRNRDVAGTAPATISAQGKHVIVIGGGDTGADCVASAHREAAASVTQIELLGEPPPQRSDELTPWPLWPVKLRTSYALKVRAGPGYRGVASRRARASGDGVRRTGAGAAGRTRRRTGRAREHRGSDVRRECARRLRRRRRPPRAVADRVGDRGGAPLRGCGQRVVPCELPRAGGGGREAMKPGPRDGFRWTRETIIYAFELWHRRHLCSPTVAEWRRAGSDNPSATTVRSAFGSWNSAVKAAGLRPRRPGEARKTSPPAIEQPPAGAVPRWPPPRVVERLQAWAHEHGRPPTLEEWRRAGARHPSAATVRRLFGSWNAALVAAGFEKRPPGIPVEPRSATHARCEKTGRWTARPA